MLKNNEEKSSTAEDSRQYLELTWMVDREREGRFATRLNIVHEKIIRNIGLKVIEK